MPRYCVSDVWAYFGVIKALLKLAHFIESLIAIMMVSSAASIWKKVEWSRNPLELCDTSKIGL